MSLSLSQSASAVCPYIHAFFNGAGGVEPYAYAVLPDGAGGVINASTGVYTAPPEIDSDPRHIYDTIEVTDANSEKATAQILVGSPVSLICEIIQKELGLAADQVYLWSQKIMQPTDNRLYVAVSVPLSKVIGNVNRSESSDDGLAADAYTTMMGIVDIDVISRSMAAYNRKEDVIMALRSNYATRQQEANTFYISKTPSNPINISEIDGGAIPYRFRFSFKMQYVRTKVKPIEYFDDFPLEQEIDP